MSSSTASSAKSSASRSAALKKLSQLLRSKGDEILNGHAVFVLTTDVLNCLNQECDRPISAHNGNHNEEMDRKERDRPTTSWRSLWRTARSCDHQTERERNLLAADIQFIQDFMLSSPELKVIHKHRTLSFPISLRPFGNLRVLELRKIPIHLVEGLHSLRGTLESLTVIRSIAKVKDLLESCGSDQSIPLTWTRLKSLSLVFNDVRSLDKSLTLVPALEKFNLSNNQISTTGNFLENLSEVSHLSLAFNQMTSVPSFSLTVIVTLKSLILRGNQLIDIEGLQNLRCLQVLDLGENYLATHQVLAPLKGLERLRQLSLDLNPLSYHKSHRGMTANQLSPQVLTCQFVLDHQRLSAMEVATCKDEVGRQLISTQPVLPRVTPASPLRRPLSESSGIGTAENSPEPIASPAQRKSGRRKRRKARDTEIKEFDASGEWSSADNLTPYGSPSLRNLEREMEKRQEEARKTQMEVEKLRDIYGPNWLQAIQDRNLFNNVVAATPKSQRKTAAQEEHKREQEVVSDTTSETERLEEPETSGTLNDCPTEDDLYLRETTVDPVNNPIMVAIARLAAGETDKENMPILSDTQLSPSSHTVTSVMHSSPNKKTIKSDCEDIVVKFADIDTTVSQNENLCGKSDLRIAGIENNNFEKDKTYFRSENVNTGNEAVSTLNDNSCIVSESKSSRLTIEQSNTLRTKKGPSGVLHDSVKEVSGEESEEKDTISSVHVRQGQTDEKIVERNEKSPQEGKGKTINDSNDSEDWSAEDPKSPEKMTEGEQESEPMFVTLPDQADVMMMLTLTDLFIVEKDVRGHVKEKLDMRSLLSLKASEFEDTGQGQTTDGEQGKSYLRMKLDLRFDYVRKDRQQRCYLLEQEDGQSLRERLQPFLAAREEEARKKDAIVMQCLKCNRSFQKNKALHRRKTLPTSGSCKDFKALQELSESVTMECPHCGSSLLIEIESKSHTVKRPESATSVSKESHSSSGSGSTSKQEQEVKQEAHNVKKPSPLLRNASFDTQSRQGRLAARIARTRKSSLENSTKTPALATSSSSAAEGRGRSNAFTDAGQGQITPLCNGSVTPPESCLVEDHFNKETITASQRLAQMTMNLRGSNSSLNRVKSSDHLQDKELQGKALAETTQRDSPKSDQLEQNSVPSSDMHRPDLLKLSCEERIEKDACLGEKQGDIVGPKNRKDEESVLKNAEQKGNEGGKSYNKEREVKTSVGDDSRERRSLMAMEALVNSMAREGNALEERDNQRKAELASNCSWSQGEEEVKTISVAELRKLFPAASPTVSTSRRVRVDSVDSDIVAIPRPSKGDDLFDMTDSAGHRREDRRSAARFIVGSVDSHRDESVDEGGGVVGVSSPLSSSICNSMVSSIYENVAVPDDNGAVLASCPDSHSALAAKLSVDSVDSAILRLKDSDDPDENVPSIYDRPSKQLKSANKKKSQCGNEDCDGSQAITANMSDQPSDEMNRNSTSYLDLLDRISLGGSRVSEVRNVSRSFEDSGDVERFNDSLALEEEENDRRDHEENDDLDGASVGSGSDDALDHLDHRLSLHLVMSVFENVEEFRYKIFCDCQAYLTEEPYPALLILSTLRFYLFKVDTSKTDQEPQRWLTCAESQPIPELRYLDLGLGGQSLRLEFSTDGSCYTLITRNKHMSLQFMEALHSHLAHYAVSQGVPSHVVVNEDVDQNTLDNLDTQVLSKVLPGQSLLLYVMAFIQRGFHSKFPISLVVSPSEVCLVRANHQWPQPRLQPPFDPEAVGKQFTVLERQKINNIASLEVCELTLRRIQIELFNEIDGVSTIWKISVATKESMMDLVSAISEPWSREFGVEMDITYSVLDFGDDE